MNENMTISNFSGWGIVIFFVIIIAAFAWFVRDGRDRYPGYGRSREGAWIEITGLRVKVSPGMSRSREGAWIEIFLVTDIMQFILSLPRGSVD